MDFEKHLFISYAHIDNKPLTSDEQGWITRLHSSLEAMLSMRLGRSAVIWRDAKLDGNDTFADEIVDQFPKTALLISVLTPRYVQSEWCTKEVKEFCQVAERTGGLIIDNKSRVFKVIKTPVESERALPDALQRTLGYEFYTLTDDDVPLELDPAYGQELAQRYNMKVAKLAWDVAQLVNRLRTESAAEHPEDAASAEKPCVYLAECSYDQRDAREGIESELRLHGYTVLPSEQLPKDESAYREAVTGLLERSALSIHLIGASGGVVLDGPNRKPVVELQNELAIDRSRAGAFSRVIWLPGDTEPEHQDHQRFLNALHEDATAQFAAELVTEDFEYMKGVVHATLKRLAEADAKEDDPSTGDVSALKLVYIICDQRDRKATLPLRKLLMKQGFEVAIPVFEGDAGQVRQANHDVMVRCHAAIIFYGAGDEAWKRTVETDLQKINGYRADTPLTVCYTFLAAPLTDDKEELIELEEPRLINGIHELSETAIQELAYTMKRGTPA